MDRSFHGIGVNHVSGTFCIGKVRTLRKIHVDSAALTHQPSLDLRSKGWGSAPTCGQVFDDLQQRYDKNSGYTCGRFDLSAE
jgi:hypothetical protein